MFSSLAVYCGANKGFYPEYTDAAIATGKYFAEQNIHLVYGGGSIGLMGKVADACLSASGKVTGVCPRFLIEKEVGHQNVSELIVVENMHERKDKMAQLSEGFVALPGGMGTLEELFEMLTWKQLLLHQKPIGLLNVRGFWDPLLQQLERMVDEGFLHPQNRSLMVVDENIESLVSRMAEVKPKNGMEAWWVTPK